MSWCAPESMKMTFPPYFQGKVVGARDLAFLPYSSAINTVPMLEHIGLREEIYRHSGGIDGLCQIDFMSLLL
jgi:hypothetical protein